MSLSISKTDLYIFIQDRIDNLDNNIILDNRDSYHYCKGGYDELTTLKEFIDEYDKKEDKYGKTNETDKAEQK